MHNLIYGELSDKVIGCAYQVYNNLGYGHPEKLYQKCLAIELEKQGIGYQRERYSRILYDGEVVGKYFLDFLIEDKMAVELKVRREIYKKDWMQLLNYLKATNLKVGITIVFSKDGLKLRRVVN